MIPVSHLVPRSLTARRILLALVLHFLGIWGKGSVLGITILITSPRSACIFLLPLLRRHYGSLDWVPQPVYIRPEAIILSWFVNVLRHIECDIK